MSRAWFFLPSFVGLTLISCIGDQQKNRICTAGTLRCQGAGAQLCSPDGTTWQPASCREGQACVDVSCGPNAASCTDVCKDIICTPGERLCLEDNVFIYECDETGTGVRSCGSCAASPINGICFAGECVSLCGTEQKSYLGCEFFAVDLDNARVPCNNASRVCDAAASQYALVLSNPDPFVSAFVSITRGEPTGLPPSDTCGVPEPDDNLVAAQVIPPKGIQIFPLPRRDVNGTILDRLAYRVAANVPITAYQFNPLANVDVFSNDATVLLPTNAVGSRYYVMTREQTFDDLKGYLTVVGISDQPTTVDVTVTAHTLGYDNGSLFIPALAPGDTFTAQLKKYEVLNIETNRIGDDLTGSLITADKNVVVYGGSEAANAPNTSRCNLTTMTCEADATRSCVCTQAEGPNCSPHAKCNDFVTCCADHLEMQLFPTNTWGKKYVAVRSYPRNQETDSWRFLAQADDTQITLFPAIATIPLLQAGEWFEIETAEDFYVDADKPVLVGQFLQGSQAPGYTMTPATDAGIGDPAFMLAVPVEQLRTSYVFLVPDQYALDYIAVAAPTGSTVRLDGTNIDSLQGIQLHTLSGLLAGQIWRAARLPVNDGFHVLDCPATCSVMVHGYDDDVSYGYPGGLNLEALQQ